MNLEFNEEKHEYKINGVLVPSVTQIIKVLYDFEGIPEDKLEHAALRGKAVHKACEIFNLGQEFAWPLSNEIVPYFEAWKKFVRETGLVVTDAERQLGHPHMMYAGTLDVSGLIKKTKWLLDIKAVSELSPATGVQLAGYMGMTGETMKRGAVQLKPDGTYKFQEYKEASDWPTFVACLSVFNFRRKHYGE